MVVSKSIVAKGGFKGGPWGSRYPSPLLSLLNISALHVQNGIQAFAKFKRQNVVDCISENFNLKNFPGGACARNFLEKGAVRTRSQS